MYDPWDPTRKIYVFGVLGGKLNIIKIHWIHVKIFQKINENIIFKKFQCDGAHVLFKHCGER